MNSGRDIHQLQIENRPGKGGYSTTADFRENFGKLPGGSRVWRGGLGIVAEDKAQPSYFPRGLLPASRWRRPLGEVLPGAARLSGFLHRLWPLPCHPRAPSSILTPPGSPSIISWHFFKSNYRINWRANREANRKGRQTPGRSDLSPGLQRTRPGEIYWALNTATVQTFD